jgi:flavin reductase (DIM6/NTAB) family NADH-FMN oxidoreductase RutF
LIRANGRTIKVPHVAESAFSMECEVMHWYDVKTDKGDPANTVIIGRVRMMHVVSSIFFPPLNPWRRCFQGES